MLTKHRNKLHNRCYLLSDNDNYDKDAEQKTYKDLNQTHRSIAKVQEIKQHQEKEEKVQYNAEKIKIEMIDAVIEEYLMKEEGKEDDSESSSIELTSEEEECYNLLVKRILYQMK